MTIQFQVLGPVEALREGRQLVLGSARPRAVLAALLLDANRIVSLDDLAERVWGADAPAQARGSLHSYFTRLRSALEGESTIVRRGHGYLLQTDPAGIDLHRFREAAALARTTDDPAAAVRHFDTALGLWRGTPLAGLDSTWLSSVRSALCAEHESVVLDRTDRRLALGQHSELVAELSRQVPRQPAADLRPGRLVSRGARPLPVRAGRRVPRP
jgi:DNA-binding SARP family transcriptional activator